MVKRPWDGGCRLLTLQYRPSSRHTHPPPAQSGTGGHVGHGKIGARVSERVYLLPPSAAQLAAVLPRCIAVKAAVSQLQHGVYPPTRTRLRGWHLAHQGGTPKQPQQAQPVAASSPSRYVSSSSRNPPRVAPSSMRPPMDHKCALLSLLTPPPGTPTCTLYLPLGTPSGEIPPPSP